MDIHSVKIQQAKLGVPHSMDHGWHVQLFLFEAIPFDFVLFWVLLAIYT